MKKHTLFKVSILALSISAAQVAAAATSPFAPLPLYLSGSSQSKAQPNVLLLLDNSGSMNQLPGGYYTYGSYSFDTFPNVKAARHICEKELNGVFRTTNQEHFVSCQPPGYYAQNWFVCPRDGNVKFPNLCPKDTYINGETRMMTLKRVMKEILDNEKNKNIRWGVSYLNYNRSSNAQDVLIGDNTTEAVKKSIEKVGAWGGTPFSSNFAKAAVNNYVQGRAIQYRCQPNFIIGLTDGEANGTDWVDQYNWFVKNWNGQNQVDGSSWGQNKITSNQWILPERFSNGTSWYTGYRQVNTDWGLFAMTHILAGKDLKETGTDNEGGDWQDKTFFDGKQTVSTSIIGFGIDNNYLKNAPQGNGAAYYTATTADELNAAFNKIVGGVNAGSGYAPVSPSVSGISGSSSSSLGSISLGLDLSKGSSTIGFLNISRKGNNLVSSEDKSKTIGYGNLTDNSQNSDRRVLMSNKDNKPKFLAAADIKWADNNAEPSNQQYYEWLIRHSSKSDAQISRKLRQRSDKAADPQRMMGDVIDSGLLQVGGTQGGGIYTPYLVTAANDGMLHIFKRNADTKINPFSLKVNWIPGSAARENGETMWDAIKSTTVPNYLQTLDANHTYLINGGITYRSTYNGHHFGLGALGQGGKGVFAFNIGGKKHDGSNQSVGVDADQNTWTETVPLWETANKHFANGTQDSAENEKLGYAVGTPLIDRIATKRNDKKTPVLSDSSNPVRYAAFVHNGYFGTENQPALYVYDALGVGMLYNVGSNGKASAPNGFTSGKVGELIKKITVPTELANSLPTVNADNGDRQMNGLSAPGVVDVDQDGISDIAYAGDMNGNLYRFDMRGASTNDWTVQRVFQGSPNHPITAAPAVHVDQNNPSKIVVTFGTGRDLHSSDLGSKTEQFFYGIKDDLDKKRDPACGNGMDNCLKEVTFNERDADLSKRTITEQTVGDKIYRKLSAKVDGEDVASKQGWYIPLKTTADTGERVTVQPVVVDNTVFFTTRVYQQDTSQADKVCSKSDSKGYSWVMGANVHDGTSLSRDTANMGSTAVGTDTVFFSGYKTQGIVSGAVFNSSNVTEQGSFSKNDQGQVKSSGGYDLDLHQDQKENAKVDYCDKEAFGDLSYTDTVSGFDSVKVSFRKCDVSLRRLSWREIF